MPVHFPCIECCFQVRLSFTLSSLPFYIGTSAMPLQNYDFKPHIKIKLNPGFFFFFFFSEFLFIFQRENIQMPTVLLQTPQDQCFPTKALKRYHMLLKTLFSCHPWAKQEVPKISSRNAELSLLTPEVTKSEILSRFVPALPSSLQCRSFCPTQGNAQGRDWGIQPQCSIT